MFDTTDDDKDDNEISRCTILHFACLDRNGSRGEQKIRIILEAAIHVDIPTLIASRQEFYSRNPNGSWEMKYTEDLTGFTPIHLLIRNSDSTVESICIICQAWRRAVHFRETRVDYTCTVLKGVMYMYDQETERLEKIVKVLLETAEKTKEGAKGLVCASDEIKGGMDTEWLSYNEFICEDTALHTATTYQSRPECFIPSLPQAVAGRSQILL